MGWLHEHGVCGSWEEYRRLPIGVLQDCRLVMEGEAKKQERDRQHASGGRR